MSVANEIEPEWDAPIATPGKELAGTSQGNAFDKPPDHWIVEELKHFGVIG